MKEFFRRLSDFLRGGFLVLLVLTAAALGIYRIVILQVKEQPESEKPAIPLNQNVYSQIMPANRGQIMDSAGRALISNKNGYNLVVEKAYFPADRPAANAVLLNTIRILQEDGYEWNDTLPISKEQPYTFEAERDKDIAALKKKLHLNDYATAENCVDKLIADYEISADYTPAEQRAIAGIRYEMVLRDFSMSNVFYLAQDLDIRTVTRIKEKRVELKGMNIIEESIREIVRGDVIPHELGYVGPIYSKEEFDELRTANPTAQYALSDQVGRTGLESALEDTLVGTKGIKQITFTNGELTSVDVTREPVGGKTVRLTLNADYQTDLQKMLSDYCYLLRTTDKECRNANCGAVVVLDTHDNGVLGAATLPTYNLNDLLDDYKSVADRANQPLINRATDGMYRPGSTFKTITATAGLATGLITGNTTFDCEKNWKFLDTWFHCTGTHHNITVTRALTVSCNIFFYELINKMGLDTLLSYERMYGLGSPLGLESGDSGGYLACPETYEKIGVEWHIGDMIQAAIGQSEIQTTPLQMAVVASTIANEGVRYKPHLVGSVWNNAMTEQISEYEPEIAGTVETNGRAVYSLIERGMIGAAQTEMPAQYDLNKIGFDVAIKTGTPQSPRGTDSFVIGYAPADKPEIAFCAMIEGGKNAKRMVRQMIELYAKYYPDTEIGRRCRTYQSSTEQETADN